MLTPSLLRPHQMKLYLADVDLKPQEIGVEVCSRQLGKSYEKLAYAIEKGIQLRDVRILFAYPGKAQGQGILELNVKKILATCPPDLMPDVKLHEGMIRFPRSGSQIVVAGTDDKDQRDKLRGSGSPLIIVDEAGTHKDLKSLVDDILGPQLDNYDGVMILVTTPPDTMDHPFLDYWEEARQRNKLVTMPITENTFYSREKKLQICARVNRLPADHPDIGLILDGKLEGNPSWEREYMCRMVADKSKRVCPDYVDASPFVEAFDRPPYTTHYVFIDQAHGEDFFAAVFASHKFAPGGGKLLVESVWMDKMRPTDFIVDQLKSVERRLKWNPENVRRFGNDPRGQQQLTDMRQRGYSVIQGAKSEGVEAEADRLNLALRGGRVVIHASCKPLREQLLNGIYRFTDSGAKADYERTPHYGHLDALAALAMGIRQVDWRRDVTPITEIDTNEWFVPPGMRKPMSASALAVNQIFRGAQKN